MRDDWLAPGADRDMGYLWTGHTIFKIHLPLEERPITTAAQLTTSITLRDVALELNTD